MADGHEGLCGNCSRAKVIYRLCKDRGGTLNWCWTCPDCGDWHMRVTEGELDQGYPDLSSKAAVERVRQRKKGNPCPDE